MKKKVEFKKLSKKDAKKRVGGVSFEAGYGTKTGKSKPTPANDNHAPLRSVNRNTGRGRTRRG